MSSRISPDVRRRPAGTFAEEFGHLGFSLSHPWGRIEHMFGRLAVRARELVVGQLLSMLRRLDPALLTGPQAAALVEWFAEVERLAAAGRALVADRAAETNQWRREGDRSPEHWLAR